MNRFRSLHTVALACALVLGAATLTSCASTTRSSSTGEYFDDTVITAKVKGEIFNDPSLKSAEINVETFKGVVQLSGFVSSQSDINRSVELARSVNGVSAVKNDMRLK
jgi:osmotically-inducible protein OsmY